ncbi:MAG: hypothetical protein KatS3mg066_2927 [Fischerella sp.]|nr:MAG: hypothetical protein KatS3mg066_2927 [Fischerella sp.]
MVRLGQVTPERVPQLEKTGTNTMRIVRRQVVLAGSQNRPTLNDREVNVQAYTPAITQGFTDVYRTLLQHRQELLKILDIFEADDVRVVMRPSRSYALLLRESYHPDVLRDALERDRLFDKLWIDVQNRPILSQVIRKESLLQRQTEIKDTINNTEKELKQILSDIQKTIIRASATGNIFNLELRNPGI